MKKDIIPEEFKPEEYNSIKRKRTMHDFMKTALYKIRKQPIRRDEYIDNKGEIKRTAKYFCMYCKAPLSKGENCCDECYKKYYKGENAENTNS